MTSVGVTSTECLPKLPGVQWIYAGTHWRWFDVIRANDVFDNTAMLTNMEEKTGRRFGKWVLQTGEVRYRRTDGGLVAIASGHGTKPPEIPSESRLPRLARGGE